MKLDADHELSPQAIAALRDLLQEPEPPRDDPSEEQLRAFALGSISPTERHLVIRALVHSAPLRQRMVHLQQVLQAQPSEALSPHLGHALGIDGQLDEWETRPVWTSLRENTAGAAIRNALDAIGRSLNVLLATPRYATVRRGAGSTALFADLDDDGTLFVEAEIDPAADGQSVSLDLIDPAGGTVRIDRSQVHHGAARFTLPEFGKLTGLESGSLPGNLFRLVWEGEATEPVEGQFLLAATDSEPAVLTVPVAPFWEAGLLHVTLALPPATQARFADDLLEISAQVGGVAVNLANVPISEFEAGERSFQWPVAGLGGRRAVCGSLLQARIVPSGSETV